MKHFQKPYHAGLETIAKLQEIEKMANSKGVELGRWDTASRKSGFCRTISYGLFRGNRPERSAKCLYRVQISRDAKTMNSEMGRRLVDLCETLKSEF